MTIEVHCNAIVGMAQDLLQRSNLGRLLFDKSSGERGAEAMRGKLGNPYAFADPLNLSVNRFIAQDLLLGALKDCSVSNIC